MSTRIIVVDDEPDLESLMQVRFRRKIQEGTYQFRFARSGREALSMIEAGEEFDVVLLDINMPGMNGLALLEQLPELMPVSRTVMVSAYGDMGNIRAAMNAGAFDFICKPLNWNDLEITIEKTARHVRLMRESRHLKVLNELKSRFFDNITHEFRTPLTLILAPVEKILQSNQYPEETLQSLEMVQRNARQLLRLINQLLDLAKLEAGHLAVSPTPGDLGEFVGQLVGSFDAVAEERHLRLVYRNDLREGYSFDAEKIEQIVYNLLSNAVKFSSRKPVADSNGARHQKILIRLTTADAPDDDTAEETEGLRHFSPVPGKAAESSGHRVRLTIRDFGIGIPADKLPYIFDRFYQIRPEPAGSDAVMVQSGTGIGLALVKDLIELMDGSLTVSSEAGRGTRFRAELPLATVSESLRAVDGVRQPAPPVSLPLSRPVSGQASSGPKPAAVPEDDPRSTQPLVLVVEDNPELRDFLSRELSPLYRVLTAPDGREGWATAQAELPDLVISDIMMPVMDGYQLTHLIKSHPSTNHIAVVLLTARTAQPSRIEGLQQGADDYLEKPFHLDELHLRLRNLLKRQHHLRERFREQLVVPDGPSPLESVQDQWLSSLYATIERHLDDSAFGVEELAEKMAVSRRTLLRKTQGLTHLTPNELLRQYRLRRGAELLRAGHLVAETAYLVGFETPSHFSQCFKEVFHVTPSEFISRIPQ
ncbi:response regulator [Larkinella soli]|uniref:response regulator n=1 Tax=Larkinella soli TaxID=1770527 RepID=UPI000FFB3AA4|nr:response regulator [Larkinella soli]